MSKKTVSTLAVSIFLISGFLSAATGTTTTTPGSPPFKPATPTTPVPKKPSIPAPTEIKKEPTKERVRKIEISQIYTEPGIVFNNEGQWVGSDYLGKLPLDIRVLTETLATVSKDKLVSDASLTDRMITKLNQQGFRASSNFLGDSILPFLHLLILVQPVLDEGYAIDCNLRLFESVKLDRVLLENNATFQAVTWEKETMVLAPMDKTAALIQKTVDELVQGFLDRYDFSEQKEKAIKTPDVERMKE